MYNLVTGWIRPKWIIYKKKYNFSPPYYMALVITGIEFLFVKYKKNFI